jgi:hypothetical protein
MFIFAIVFSHLLILSFLAAWIIWVRIVKAQNCACAQDWKVREPPRSPHLSFGNYPISTVSPGDYGRTRKRLWTAISDSQTLRPRCGGALLGPRSMRSAPSGASIGVAYQPGRREEKLPCAPTSRVLSLLVSASAPRMAGDLPGGWRRFGDARPGRNPANSTTLSAVCASFSVRKFPYLNLRSWVKTGEVRLYSSHEPVQSNRSPRLYDLPLAGN